MVGYRKVVGGRFALVGGLDGYGQRAVGVYLIEGGLAETHRAVGDQGNFIGKAGGFIDDAVDGTRGNGIALRSEYGSAQQGVFEGLVRIAVGAYQHFGFAHLGKLEHGCFGESEGEVLHLCPAARGGNGCGFGVIPVLGGSQGETACMRHAEIRVSSIGHRGNRCDVAAPLHRYRYPFKISGCACGYGAGNRTAHHCGYGGPFKGDVPGCGWGYGGEFKGSRLADIPILGGRKGETAFVGYPETVIPIVPRGNRGDITAPIHRHRYTGKPRRAVGADLAAYRGGEIQGDVPDFSGFIRCKVLGFIVVSVFGGREGEAAPVGYLESESPVGAGSDGCNIAGGTRGGYSYSFHSLVFRIGDFASHGC